MIYENEQALSKALIEIRLFRFGRMETFFFFSPPVILIKFEWDYYAGRCLNLATVKWFCLSIPKADMMIHSQCVTN